MLVSRAAPPLAQPDLDTTNGGRTFGSSLQKLRAIQEIPRVPAKSPAAPRTPSLSVGNSCSSGFISAPREWLPPSSLRLPASPQILWPPQRAPAFHTGRDPAWSCRSRLSADDAGAVRESIR